MHLIFASADAQSAAKNAGGCPWPAKKTDFQGRFTEYWQQEKNFLHFIMKWKNIFEPYQKLKYDHAERALFQRYYTQIDEWIPGIEEKS